MFHDLAKAVRERIRFEPEKSGNGLLIVSKFDFTRDEFFLLLPSLHLLAKEG